MPLPLSTAEGGWQGFAPGVWSEPVSMFTTAGTLESLSPICPCTISGWWSTHCWAAVCCPFVAPPAGGHRRNGSPRRAGVKDAFTGDIQEQDWEPLNRGDCFETVENGSGCACYLLPANRLRDDESRGCRKRVTVPVGGTCGNGRIHAGSRLHLGRPVPSL